MIFLTLITFMAHNTKSVGTSQSKILLMSWQMTDVVTKRTFISLLSAVVRLTSLDSEKSGRFLIHTLQVLPQQAYKKHEFSKFITISERGEATYAFNVVVRLISFFLVQDVLFCCCSDSLELWAGCSLVLMWWKCWNTDIMFGEGVLFLWPRVKLKNQEKMWCFIIRFHCHGRQSACRSVSCFTKYKTKVTWCI